MSDIVFILGAGASRECGGPLMSDFLDLAHDLMLSDRLSREEKANFERVFEAIDGLQIVHSKAKLDTYNIESVFTTFELAQIIQRLPGSTVDQIPSTIEALKTVIARTLELRIKFPCSESGVSAPEPYGQFGNLVRYLTTNARPTQSVSVITFNYDVSVDLTLMWEEVKVEYGLEKRAPGPRPRDVVSLLKLHGSLSWAVEEAEPNVIVPLDLMHYLRQGIAFVSTSDPTVRHMSILPKLVRYFVDFHKKKVKPLPYIVPPSWNKADYHKGLTNVWAAAANELSEASHIFVIGYSLPMTDSFFRQLYALGSAGPALRKFMVYDPDDSGLVEARFRDLMGTGAISRFEQEKRDFRDAIPHIRSMFQK